MTVLRNWFAGFAPRVTAYSSTTTTRKPRMLQLSKHHLSALRWAVGYAQPPHDSIDAQRDQSLRELAELLRETDAGSMVLVDADILREMNPNGRAFR